MYGYYQRLKPTPTEVGRIKFTAREVDILSCLLHGRGSKKIAELLSISPKTAEAHIRNIMLKLDCNSRESIIDYLEKSNELVDLNTHYFTLIKSHLFSQLLSQLPKKNPPPVKRCILIYDPQQTKEKEFFKCLETVLKVSRIPYQRNSFSTKPAQTETSDLVVCSSSVFPRARDWNPTYVLHLPAEESTGSNDLVNLDFRTEEVGIHSLLSLLHEFYPKLDPTEWLKNLNIHAEQTLSSRQPHSKERQSSPLIFISSHRYLLYSALAIIAVLPILSFSGIIHFPYSGPLVRSELPIPNHTTLLERPLLLKKLNSILQTSTQDIPRAAIVGIGGSGKSTLAKQYGKSSKASVVWQIDGSSTSSIARSFESMASALAQSPDDKVELDTINQLMESESVERDRQILHFVKRRLKDKSDWLLIYDNLENFSVAQDYFPHDKASWGNGQALITTRNDNLKNSNYLDESAVLTIGELNEDEKASLYQSIVETDSSAPLKQTSREFLQHIPPFPLDVTICAYYLKNTGTTPENYLLYMEESSEKLSAFQERLLTDVSNYKETRYGIITVSLRNLLEKHSDFLKPLLFVSLIGNQNIPGYLLNPLMGEIAANDFIYNLKNFSLITPSPEQTDSFSIHASTQKTLLSFLEKRDIITQHPEILADVAKAFIQSLKEAGNSKDAAKMRALIPHAEQFLTHAELLPLPLRGEAYGQLGRIYYYLGHYEEAKPHLVEGTNLLQSYYGPKHPKVAWITTYLGKIYRNQGQYQTAANYLKRSFKIYKDRQGEYPLKYAWVCAHLGNIYRSLGHFAKGEELLRESLGIYREHLGHNHIRPAWVAVHLANILRGQKRHTEAYNLIQASYPIFREHYGDEHSLTAWVHACLGRVLIDLGNYDEAQTILTKQLSTYRKFFGEDHIQTSWVLRGFGRLYLATGRPEEAHACLKESLDILQKRNHPDTYITLELMAELPQQDDAETSPLAKEYLGEALEIVKTHFPEDSPHFHRISHKLWEQ